jgi:phosphatidylglycerophosphate synthase
MEVYSKIKTLQKNALSDDYVVFYFYRKISAIFSTIFLKLRFSANFVTFLSLLADFLVVYLMFKGNWILAGILVNLAIILDCSDGEVARYNIQCKNAKKGKKYGGYLDETLGTIGFTLVIFFAGYFLNNLWIGLFAMYGLFMIIVSSTVSEIEFKNKKEIVTNFEKGIFGELKGRIGFSNGIQRLFISIAIIFSSLEILFLFGVAANLFWLLKYWVYRKY